MANGDSTADKAVWVQGRSGEDSPMHLADLTDGVNCEREKNKKSSKKEKKKKRKKKKKENTKKTTTQKTEVLEASWYWKRNSENLSA